MGVGRQYSPALVSRPHILHSGDETKTSNRKGQTYPRRSRREKHIDNLCEHPYRTGMQYPHAYNQNLTLFPEFKVYVWLQLLG